MNVPSGCAAVPAGYVEIDVGGPFIAGNGPLHAAWIAGKLRIGLRIEARHCNPAGVCHGGMLASFADMMLPYSAMYSLQVPRRFTPTISLHTDFIAPAPSGAWLEGSADVVRSTTTMLFVQGVAQVDGKVVLHASGIFKWGDAVATSANPRDPFGVLPAPSHSG